MNNVILTCNAGSHNTKLAAFDAETQECLGHIQSHNEAETMAWLCAAGQPGVAAVAHRVVHGGTQFAQHAHITPKVVKQLHGLAHLAPLHQPHALKLIQEAEELYPDVPHIACFDTGFFRDLPEIETRLPIPRKFHDQGMRRYGFHGLSYQFIVQSLPHYLENKAHDRVIVAHLGGGASMCALHGLKPVATTMGFSTLDGMMMSTRPGALDPGLLLHLLEEYRMKPSELSEMLYNECGLKGVSGISGDMRTLVESKRTEAKEAMALYCHLAARQLAGLLPALGGLDALVFTGGIGQHRAEIRHSICSQLHWLGIRLNDETNRADESFISALNSNISVYVIPTNEEKVMVGHCRHYLDKPHAA